MTTTENAAIPGQTGQPEASAQPKKEKLPRELDPRNPNTRLAAFFDEGTLELISADDDSGMLAAVGEVDGVHTVAFCSDATIMGGAMGHDGCQVVVQAYERALADGAPGVRIERAELLLGLGELGALAEELGRHLLQLDERAGRGDGAGGSGANGGGVEFHRDNPVVRGMVGPIRDAAVRTAKAKASNTPVVAYSLVRPACPCAP